MSGPRVQIGELRLRVSGLTRGEARRLGVIVAARLAEAPLQGSGSISSLSVTVRPSRSVEGTAEAITKQIRRRLK